MRQRRGQLLRRVIAEGSIAVTDADRDAAVGLAADGLVALADGWVLAPGRESASAEASQPI